MNLFLANKTLDEILPESVFSTPAVSIRVDDTLGDAASLLPHHLETLTDSLVATSNDKPVGIVGGIEVLEGIIKNQTPGFLDKAKIGDVMSKKLVIVNPKTKFSELAKQWSQTRRAFAIIPNQYHGYSVISARKILDVGVLFKTNTTISVVPRRKIATFHKYDTVRQIIQRMFDNKTRKLVLDGTDSFISDRIIIQKLVREFNCLRDGRDFLETGSDIFSLEQAKRASEDLTITEACRIMQEMRSPYLMSNEKTISPWDIISVLAFENLS
ncbi:MAG: CBS domain-containing protein [Thaumarchaeota archaeon]|nr:CBS domain-containing protein [Nitrososphaerota archaeon]